MIPALLAPPQKLIQALAGSWYAYLSPQPVNDRSRNVVNMMTCWILAERSNLSISFGISLFMLAPLSEKPFADVREDVQKNVDTDERKHAHREHDERKLGKMGDRMERFMGDRRDKLGRRPAVAFSAG